MVAETRPRSFLNERGPGAGVLDQNTPRVPSFGEGLHACLEGGVIDALPPHVAEIPKLLACHDPGRANRPVVVGACSVNRRSGAGGSYE